MKIYFKIFLYAPRLVFRLIQFFILSWLEICFSVLNLAMTIPMLRVLFKEEDNQVVPPLPEYSFSISYFPKLFEHYFTKIIVDNGPMAVLFFLCLGVSISVLLTNVFRYSAVVAASRIKVDIIKNLRMDFFKKVTLLHLGFFNDQRKGDMITRFTQDVTEVENAVLNGMKFVLKEPFTILVYFGVLFR